jgi:DMSO reductase family type II enzyme heme b subunit
MIKKTWVLFIAILLGGSSVYAERQRFVEFTSSRVNVDVSKINLDDPVWREIKPYRQPLQEQFLETPKPAEVGVKEVLVQSINDGDFIAFRLTWKDDTKNDRTGITNFSDGAAIQFPIKKDALPQFFMGEGTKGVHILYWKAWRSRDEREGFQSVKSAYPNMTSDMYNFDYAVSGQGTQKTEDEKNMFIPGRAAKNPISFPRKEIVEELSSMGPGTITTMNAEHTSGDADWEKGEWKVLFRRPLKGSAPGSVEFKPGEKMPVSFAVWEGSRLEVGGRKAVSPAWAEVEVAK